MHFRSRSVLRALSVPIAIVSFFQITAVHAANRFAGYYELSNVVEEGDQIHVTMKLTMFNPGNSDIKNSVVDLLDSSPNPVLIGSFSTIKTMPHLSWVQVSQKFTVSIAEYANWQHGHAPLLQIRAASADAASGQPIQMHQVTKPGAATN
jgi:hypothetical protein